MSNEYNLLLLGAAFLLTLGVLASKLSFRVGIPALVLFLGIGMFAGSDGPGGYYFDNWKLTQEFGVLALAYIIFAGGLDSNIGQLRKGSFAGALLAGPATLLTALLLAALAMLLLTLEWPEAFLLGAIVCSTDAAAVFNVLRSSRMQLNAGLREALELESGANDAVAVTLVMFGIQMLQGTASTTVAVTTAVVQLAIGGALGYALARIAILVFNRIQLEYDGLYVVLIAAFPPLVYGAASLAFGNGFLAVYIAGLVMAHHAFVRKRSVLRFMDGVAWVLQIAVFILLGLLVFPSQLPTIAINGIAVAALLMVVARPAATIIALLPVRMAWRERLFCAWVGLRGAGPIIFATFPYAAGVQDSHEMFHLVFFVVLFSLLFQGATVRMAARLTGVGRPVEALRARYPFEFENMEDADRRLEEILIPYGSIADGMSLAELGLSGEAVVVVISRGDGYISPGGATVLRGGDALLALVSDSGLKELQERLRPETTASRKGGG